MKHYDAIGAFAAPEKLPIAFNYGGRAIHGLPAEFNPVAVRSYPDSDITLYTVTGHNADGLEIKVEQTVYADYPVTETVAYFTNTGSVNTPVISDMKIFDDYFLPCASPRLIHGTGDNCSTDGYSLDDDKLDSPVTINPKPHSGTPCCGASPYMRVYSENGGGYNIAVGWTGTWRADYTPCEGGFKLTVGQYRSNMYIAPGETMRTPRLTLMAFDGGQYEARNDWRRWYLRHILPRENGEPIEPKLCLHVFADGGPEFSGTTAKNQVAGLDTYASRGMTPDVWWFDAGWYKCDLDWPRIGTWGHDPERFPDGLKPVGDKCKELGALLLLWFEPERVTPGTELAVEHPDWILCRKGENISKDQGLLDLGNKAANDWITDRIDKLIKDYGVTFYRQDFNYDPMPNWESNEAPDRIGARENLHVQGYLRYWDNLKERNPGLLFDSCASGGRRNDLDTMRRAVPLQYTDVGLGVHPLKQIQHRYMFEWIPYFRAHTLNFDDGTVDMPNSGKYNASCPTDLYSYHCAMAPAITVMTDRNDTEERFILSRKMNKIWRRAAKLELSCDYIPLSECRRSAEDWYAMQFDSPERGEGFFQAVRNTLSPDDSYTLKLKTEPDALYELEEAESGEKSVCDGVSLATFTVTLPKRSGKLWFYHKLSK